MSHYRHVWNSGKAISFPAGKVLCVGQNYKDHNREMRSSPTEEPVLFMKPSTALVPFGDDLVIPKGYEVHHEVELVLLVGETMSRDSGEGLIQKISGFGIGLDLTLRDLQTRLKKAGLPWEKSKAFDGSAVVSSFIPAKEFPNPQKAELRLSVNGQVRQNGNTSDMIWDIPSLLAHAVSFFTLLPGDLIFTGTPAGVGPLASGDELEAVLAGTYSFRAKVSLETAPAKGQLKA